MERTERERNYNEEKIGENEAPDTPLYETLTLTRHFVMCMHVVDKTRASTRHGPTHVDTD
eukprot:m.210353 g.210353  ORF g.210353 m.210353 type:complete len:60 (-) comp24964_c0_seq1:746-925(-)